MPNELGIKSSTTTAFLNDKLTPEKWRIAKNHEPWSKDVQKSIHFSRL